MFKKEQNSIFRSLLLFFITAFLFIFPDILFFWINYQQLNILNVGIKSYLFLIPLVVSITISPSNLFKIFIICFFGLLQVIQFAHIEYFGTQVSAFALYMLHNEIFDVYCEAKSLFFQYSYIIPLVFCPFLAIYYINKKYFLNTYKTKLSYGIMLILLGNIALNIALSPKPRFTPNTLRLPLNNSIKAFFGFFVIKYAKYENIEYKTYQVKNLGVNKPKTIVIIIGESMNYKYMSLFGYEKDTTPLLKQLAKEKNFYYTEGISSGTSTLISTKFINNLIYEPNNIKMVGSEVTNLFKLAKMNGFKTFYISAQSDHMLSSVGNTQNIDVLITYENYPIKFKRFGDQLLLEIFRNYTLSDKNFIVFHQRYIHSPYINSFPQDYTDDKKFYSDDDINEINQYRAAMCHNDVIISNFFKEFNKLESDFYIVWLSDHNELCGENGYWGHGHQFCPEAAQIPILIQSNDFAFLQKVKQIFIPTHYEIIKMITEELGYQITNPNEQENIFYINGVNFCGKGGYIKIIKAPDQRNITYVNVE